MKRLSNPRIVLALFLASGALTAAPALAHGSGYGQGGASYGPCFGKWGTMGQGMGPGMGPGMMGPGMTGQGMGPGMMGQGMDPGMMGQGMDPGMMGQGMGPGMMGQGMDPGMMGQGVAPQAYLDRDLSPEEVRGILEHRLEHWGNERLRVGKVEATEDDAILAEIETVDGSLVERYSVDRHTGRMQRAE